MLVKSDSTVELRPIETSQVMGAALLVESGLKAGEQVIVAGLQKIRPGAPVKAVASGQASGKPEAAGTAKPMKAE